MKRMRSLGMMMIGLGEEHEEDGAHLGGLCAADNSLKASKTSESNRITIFRHTRCSGTEIERKSFFKHHVGILHVTWSKLDM